MFRGFVLAGLFLGAVSYADPCTDLQPKGDVLTWLKSFRTQGELKQVFDCAERPAAETKVPEGMGKGYGSLFNTDEPALNDLQNALGQLLWGGKRFTKSAQTGKTSLVNVMKDTNTDRYVANVYVAKSIVDQKQSVVLDYRFDESAKKF